MELVVLQIMKEIVEQIHLLELYLQMVVEVVDLHRHQPLTYKVIQEDLEVEMQMILLLMVHHQVMFNLLVHHKETMVGEVDKVDVMVLVVVEVLELLEEKVDQEALS